MHLVLFTYRVAVLLVCRYSLEEQFVMSTLKAAFWQEIKHHFALLEAQWAEHPLPATLQTRIDVADSVGLSRLQAIVHALPDTVQQLWDSANELVEERDKARQGLLSKIGRWVRGGSSAYAREQAESKAAERRRREEAYNDAMKELKQDCFRCFKLLRMAAHTSHTDWLYNVRCCNPSGSKLGGSFTPCCACVLPQFHCLYNLCTEQQQPHKRIPIHGIALKHFTIVEKPTLRLERYATVPYKVRVGGWNLADEVVQLFYRTNEDDKWYSITGWSHSFSPTAASVALVALQRPLRFRNAPFPRSFNSSEHATNINLRSHNGRAMVRLVQQRAVDPSRWQYAPTRQSLWMIIEHVRQVQAKRINGTARVNRFTMAHSGAELVHEAGYMIQDIRYSLRKLRAPPGPARRHTTGSVSDDVAAWTASAAYRASEALSQRAATVEKAIQSFHDRPSGIVGCLELKDANALTQLLSRQDLALATLTTAVHDLTAASTTFASLLPNHAATEKQLQSSSIATHWTEDMRERGKTIADVCNVITTFAEQLRITRWVLLVVAVCS